MANSNPDQKLIHQRRKVLTDGRKARARCAWRLQQAKQRLAHDRSRYGDQHKKVRQAKEEYRKALDALVAARQDLQREKNNLGDSLSEWLPTDSADEMARLSTDLPIVMFPVRLETRFAHKNPDPAFAGELKIRIYPDGIVADNHVSYLTEEERDAGYDYWNTAWKNAEERDAWSTLLKEMKATRAAWVVKQTEPRNMNDFPSEPDTGDDPNRPKPQFPQVALRPLNWRETVEARLLPDRWLVLAYRNYPENDPAKIKRVLSNPVQEPLALTLNISKDGEEEELDDSIALSNDGLKVDPEILWSFNFNRAVEVGMAVRIDLTQEELDEGFDRILVLGVKSSLTPEQATEQLGALIDCHHYTRGFAFVAQGTNTNNVSGEPAGYPLPDPNGEISFTIERDKNRNIEVRDGARFAQAFGLPQEHFVHIAGAERDEQTPARAMANVLWLSTIGYFLEQMMAPHFNAESVQMARQYFVDYVRARGMWPAFRVGAVPYGLLAVTSLAHWRPRDSATGPDKHLPPLLRRTRDIWMSAVDEVPRINKTGDPDADLLTTLGMDASTREVYVRTCLGPQTQTNTQGFLGIDLPSWGGMQEQIEQALLDHLGLGEWAPRVARLSYADHAEKFSFGLVTNKPDEVLSETHGLKFDYINWIRSAGPDQLRAEKFPEGVERPISLLYLMLRHAYLTEYARCARQLLWRRKLLMEEEFWEHELVDIVPMAQGPQFGETVFAAGAGATGTPSPSTGNPDHEAAYLPTIWERFQQPVPGVTQGRPLGEFLAIPRHKPQVPEDRDLSKYRSSLAALEGLPTAELERLFSETLDVGSHRRDAWDLSLSGKRLLEMREAKPQGCYLGAYGWLENLKAKPPPERRSVKLLGNRKQSAIVDDRNVHILTPSMNHAAAVAVLCNARKTRSGENQQIYALNLSSARVRTAMWFMDAVRDHPLGEVSGAHFERGLHERHAPLELDKFKDDFRNLYPLVANKTTDSGEPAESVAARNVVDGLALRRAWQKQQKGEGEGIPWDRLHPTPDPQERAAIEAELRELDDIFDAITDLLMAESVYQLVRGGTYGAAASVDSMAKGVRSPELEIARPLRGGTDVYHRVGVVLGGEPPAAPWPVPARSPRGEVEPYLNGWVGSLLGLPDKVICKVSYPDPADPTTTKERTVSLGNLKIEPLDVLAMARAVETEAAESELDRRVAYVVALDAAEGAHIDIEYDIPGLAADERSFPQILEMARAINIVLGSARPLRPADLIPPELEEQLNSADLMSGELADRAALAMTRLEHAWSGITDAIDTVMNAPTGTDPNLDGLRDALRKASQFGVTGAYPTNRKGHGASYQEPLLTQARSVRNELIKRFGHAQLETDPVKQIQHVFGGGFKVLPRFVPASADGLAQQLAQALTQGPDLGPNPKQASPNWLLQTARVRKVLGQWRQLALYEGTGGHDLTDFDVLQFPHVDGAPWVGLPFDNEDKRPPDGRVSLLLYRPVKPGANDPWVGLFLDDWTERIPNAEEDGGVVFRYDAPNAQAPQAVLLVVPPAIDPKHTRWDLEVLIAILNETLDSAKMRALDGEHLGALAQALPMTYLASNPSNDAISTSFMGMLFAEAVILQQEL